MRMRDAFRITMKGESLLMQIGRGDLSLPANRLIVIFNAGRRLEPEIGRSWGSIARGYLAEVGRPLPQLHRIKLLAPAAIGSAGP